MSERASRRNIVPLDVALLSNYAGLLLMRTVFLLGYKLLGNNFVSFVHVQFKEIDFLCKQYLFG